MFTRKLQQFIYKREGKRWPFMAAPLRQAGQGIREELEDVQTSMALALAIIPGLAILFIGSMINGCMGKPASFWWTNGRFQDFQNTDFNVVTEKTLLNFIAKRPKILAMAEVREIGTLLEGSLRKERQSILKIGQ